MRSLLILLLMSLLFLVGCNDKGTATLKFTGESNHWKCEYVQKSIETWTKDSSGKLDYENSSNNWLNLKYKGNDISDLGIIKYSYVAGPSRGSGETMNVDKNGNVITGRGGGKNVSLTRKDEVIKVTIEWNGEKETIKLINK